MNYSFEIPVLAVGNGYKLLKRRSKITGETNGWEFEWIWEGISTSRDHELGWKEKPVGQVLDMYIA